MTHRLLLALTASSMGIAKGKTVLKAPYMGSATAQQHRGRVRAGRPTICGG